MAGATDEAKKTVNRVTEDKGNIFEDQVAAQTRGISDVYVGVQDISRGQTGRGIATYGVGVANIVGGGVPEKMGLVGQTRKTQLTYAAQLQKDIDTEIDAANLGESERVDKINKARTRIDEAARLRAKAPGRRATLLTEQFAKNSTYTGNTLLTTKPGA